MEVDGELKRKSERKTAPQTGGKRTPEVAKAHQQLQRGATTTTTEATTEARTIGSTSRQRRRTNRIVRGYTLHAPRQLSPIPEESTKANPPQAKQPSAASETTRSPSGPEKPGIARSQTNSEVRPMHPTTQGATTVASTKLRWHSIQACRQDAQEATSSTATQRNKPGEREPKQARVSRTYRIGREHERRLLQRALWALTATTTARCENECVEGSLESTAQQHQPAKACNNKQRLARSNKKTRQTPNDQIAPQQRQHRTKQSDTRSTNTKR